MPLIISPQLPAIERLKEEGLQAMPADRTCPADVRPLRIGVLNLMPMKLTTETDLVRVLSPHPLWIELTWISLATHTPRHVSADHMQRFYRPFPEVEGERFDGLIITGAPVENMPFEEVTYWPELCRIFRWARTNVRSTLHVCWAAQAGLYYHHGIQKHPRSRKLFGIFSQQSLQPTEPIMRGFDDVFQMPHSRHTELRRDDITACPALRLIAEGEETGVSIMGEADGRDLYITGHLEYARDTLHNEYERDRGKRDDVDLPCHYYPHDDSSQRPVMNWRAHAHLFYSNWVSFYVCP